MDPGVHAPALTIPPPNCLMQPLVHVRYVADTAFFPYGDRSSDSIRERVLHIGEKLVEEGCDLLVVACNTACSVALEELRERCAPGRAGDTN